MNYKTMKILVVIFFCALTTNIFADANEAEIMRAMRDEINRSMQELKLDKLQKPYFIEYILQIKSEYSILARTGSIIKQDITGMKFAYLTTRVRVGDYKFDNSGFWDVNTMFFGSTTNDDNERYTDRSITADLDYQTLRRELWLTTDAAYKVAAEILSKKEALVNNFVRRDTTWSFSKVKPLKSTDTFNLPEFDSQKFTDLAVSASKVFVDYPEIFASNVKINYCPETIYYVNSEGSEYIKNNSYIQFEALGVTQRDDGMAIADIFSCVGKTPEDKSFPSKDSILKATRQIAENIKTMLKANSLEETYNGPILFYPQAACDLIAQNFANKLTAQQENKMNRGWVYTTDEQVFQTKVGGRVLPTFISVQDLPSMKEFQGVNLVGSYKIDDDGVLPQDVLIIDKGYLKTLLSDRNPTRRVRESNGHKRYANTCYSNLKINVDKKYQMSENELKDELIRICKERELPYGIIVKKIINTKYILGRDNLYALSGGTLDSPDDNALMSYSIYKLYPNGREEPVVGGNLSGFTPAVFKEIIKTGNKPHVYNSLKREPGWFFSVVNNNNPVSVIAPALLFEECELRLVETDYQKPKILSNPILER